MSLTCLLANSTFLKKISHSSHQLRENNVRGSFLGHDIIRNYEGIPNAPACFERLFLLHREFTWLENLRRLVEATNSIVGTGRRLSLGPIQLTALSNAARIASRLSNSNPYLDTKSRLDSIVTDRRALILKACTTENINLRGNKIEQIISDAANQHGVEDLEFKLPGGIRLLVDIKTKMLDLQSSPKGYNIDKVLHELISGPTAFSFYLIGVIRAKSAIKTSLVSILDSTILNATRIQFHWAGRNSRGVTQLTGDFSKIFAASFLESIDIDRATAWLAQLAKL